MPLDPTVRQILKRLDALRIELVEQAFALDAQGNATAADLAMITSARLSELGHEYSPEIFRQLNQDLTASRADG